MLQQIIRRTIVVASLVVPTVAFSAPAALSARQDFEIHNITPSTIVGVWVAPIDYDGTVKNSLNTTVPSGRSTSILFPEGLSSCYFDIQVELSNGDTIDYIEVDLCEVGDLIVR